MLPSFQYCKATVRLVAHRSKESCVDLGTPEVTPSCISYYPGRFPCGALSCALARLTIETVSLTSDIFVPRQPWDFRDRHAF